MEKQSRNFGIFCLQIVSMLLAVSVSQAQFTYPGCEALKSSDFASQNIVARNIAQAPLALDADMAEPVAFDLDGIYKNDTVAGVDIYFVERKGKFKRYNSQTNTVSTIGTLDVRAATHSGATDYGLMGIALAPDFATSKELYLWYAPRLNDQGVQYSNSDWKQMRLSRFKLAANGNLDMASEKKLIVLKGDKSDWWHAGGPMQFDEHGDLWITIGNNSTDHDPNNFSHLSRTDSNTSDEWGASNTANMRGGIIRIHPDKSVKGYSIPAGNFGEFWAQKWEEQGNAALAAQYRDTSRVLPEIYAKGHRSNFSISVHPTKKWMAWSEINFESNKDEWNLKTEPTFSGYPYFHGDLVRTAGHQQILGGLMDPNAPKNTSPLKGKGVVDLPPVSRPTLKDSGSAASAISGPIYDFRTGLNSKVKFPPHLHESWITMEFMRNLMYISKVSPDGKTVSSTTLVSGAGGLFQSIGFDEPLAAKYGPDGTLYTLSYSGGLYTVDKPRIGRTRYVGSCVQITPIADRGSELLRLKQVVFNTSGVKIAIEGNHTVVVRHINGKTVHEWSGDKPANYDLRNPGHVQKGVYIVDVKTAKGTVSGRSVLF